MRPCAALGLAFCLAFGEALWAEAPGVAGELRSFRPATVRASQTAGGSRLHIAYDDTELDLVLEPQSLRSPAFRLLVQDDDGDFADVDAPPSATYRGVIEGQEHSKVAVTERDGRFWATLYLDPGKWWFVEPLPRGSANAAGAQEYAVYQRADIIAGPGHCGAEGDGGGTQKVAGGPAAVAGGTLRVADLAVDADVQFFQANGGSVAATLADIENVVNGVSLIYEREANISYELTTVVIRTQEPDPYSSTDAHTLLQQFRNSWNAFMGGVHRDIAHLFTGKNLDTNIIGVAYTDTMCDACEGGSGYGLSQSRFESLMGRRVCLTAHELGHNWGAEHCDGQPDCGMMCSNLGACNGACDEFGSTTLSVISNTAASAGCLSIPSPGPSFPLCETFSDGLAAGTWSYIAGAQVATDSAAAPSPPAVLRLNRCCTACAPGPDEVRLNIVDLSQVSEAIIGYWAAYAGGNPASQLVVDYRNAAGHWTELDRLLGGAADDGPFVQGVHGAPADAFHDAFRLRFRLESSSDTDEWSIDNVIVAPALPSSPVLHVREDATSAGEGAGWKSAYASLSEALVLATCAAPTVREVWVAGGTYRPDGADVDRTATFRIPKGVALLGGFNGTEVDAAERDPGRNPTILSGEAGLPFQPSDDVYHVVTIPAGDEDTVIDGFTILGGNATATVNDGGGALRVLSGRPRIAHCRLQNNQAYLGGALYVALNAGADVERCTFLGNGSLSHGGAIYAGQGSTLQMAECSLLGNVSNAFGGGVYLSTANANLSDCALGGNRGSSGGGIYAFRGSAALANCTLYQNAATASVGGLLASNSNVNLRGCIFWDNSDNGGIHELSQVAGASAIVNYTCMRGWSGGFGGVGNTGADPLLADADGADDQAGTLDDDVRLVGTSPVRDAGDPNLQPAPGFTDLVGAPRVLCGRVDMGAIESGLADGDCNGSVEASDFGYWGSCATGPAAPYSDPLCAGFDFNVDGRVDLADFLPLQSAWGDLVTP